MVLKKSNKNDQPRAEMTFFGLKSTFWSKNWLFESTILTKDLCCHPNEIFYENHRVLFENFREMNIIMKFYKSSWRNHENMV